MTYTVTCRLTACTPGSAPGPTLGIEYGKPLPLPFYHLYQFTSWRSSIRGRPRLWNSLPTYVRRLDLSLDTFRRKLKTYSVFKTCSRDQGLVTVAFRRCVQLFLLTYLLRHVCLFDSGCLQCYNVEYYETLILTTLDNSSLQEKAL